MVKRPIGIKLAYLNIEGDEIEEELFNFRARVFLHNLDHVNGRTMTHWRLSEGNLDIIDDHKDHYKNL
jgi:peptide deformylase